MDDLVSGAAREADDIDEIIRMAEAGIKPPKKTGILPPVIAEALPPVAVSIPISEVPTKPETTAKKSKKDKPTKMVYSDDDISPEEKMALMPRYAFIPDGKIDSPAVATTVSTGE